VTGGKSVTIVCEIAFAPVEASASQTTDFIARLARARGLISLDLYTPASKTTADPYVQDGAAPAHLALLAFPSIDALERAARHESFVTAIEIMQNTVVSCTAMRRTDHAVAGSPSAALLSAPFSYVVRYHRPAEDETLFVQHYLADHPPLLARLPGIRNVMCYIPLAWQHQARVPAADYMLGNEVVFDDMAAFNAAMASPVRHELRAHFRQFPSFSGKNTHFAMHRRRVPLAPAR
jgi:uncharacterized protein (TIGR02118 family)